MLSILLMLAVAGQVLNNRDMGFAEEFRNLDPDRVERAYANISEELLRIAAGEDSALDAVQQQEDIKKASFGFMVLVGRHEEAIQMISEVPGMEYSRDRYRMIQMGVGILVAGRLLTEYARLEAEEIKKD